MTEVDDYYAFFKKVTLLEIKTLIDYEESRPKEGEFVKSAGLKNAYKDRLENIYPFAEIDWSKSPFADFSVLKFKPPESLKIENGKIVFRPNIHKVESWEQLIDSFRQVRNNLCHGCKLFKNEGLIYNDRDDELIKAALSFVQLLENEGLIKHLY